MTDAIQQDGHQRHLPPVSPDDLEHMHRRGYIELIAARTGLSDAEANVLVTRTANNEDIFARFLVALA